MVQELTTPPDGMPQEVIDFRTRTLMPEEDVDEIWFRRPGWLEAALSGALAEIVSRLRKRYRTPYTDAGGVNPRPEVVVQWQQRLVTPSAYAARGMDPAHPSMVAAAKERDDARAEMKEAADARDGLYDLPLLVTGDGTGIVHGGPLGYAEPSPYDWQDVQAEALRGR